MSLLDEVVGGAEPTPQAAPAASPPSMLDQVVNTAKQVYSTDPWKMSDNLDKLNDQINQGSDVDDPNPKVAAKVGQNPGMLEAATSLVPAVKSQLVDQQHGAIFKVLDALTIPEQMIARQALVMLKNVGLMPPEEAKKLLSTDNFMAHDIVNYFYQKPTSFGSRVLRFGMGLGADILTDPLSYIGIGELTEAGKTANVAGETISALDKLSGSQRMALKAASKVEKIINADGALKPFEDVAEHSEAIANNLDHLKEFAKSQLSTNPGDKMGMEDLFEGLDGLHPSVEREAKRAYSDALDPGSYFHQWATGERGYTVGYKIPFTRIAKTIDLPLAAPVSKFQGTMAESILKGLGNSPVIKNPVVKWVQDFANSTWTKTGFPVYDASVNMSKGYENATHDFVTGFAKESYDSLKDSNLPQVADYIERKVYNPAERAAEYGGDEHLLAKLSETPPQEAKLKPEELAFAKQSREILDAKLAEEKSRPGLYSERLSPVAPGSANEYLKHVFTEEWLNHNKQVNDAVEYAYENLEKLGANVDKSNLGRRYRGTIAEANLLSHGKEGIQMFVDDPVYLTAKRVLESDRAIRNYDLMESAADHALMLEKGEIAPQGYVRVQKEHFGTYEAPTGQQFYSDPAEALKKSPDGYVWKRFVPPRYLESEGKMWMPERLYNDMKNRVVPQTTGSFMQGIINSQDAFMRVFRNTALFGPGYVGMKVMSDLQTMAFNGMYSNPFKSLVDAVRVIHTAEPEAKFAFQDNMGRAYSLSREQVWENLMTHNVIRSGIGKLMDIPQVAENIASGRSAGFGTKALNFLDMANLWSVNRQLVKFAEDIPKVAVWMDRMKAGFSPEGAAEAAERLFGTFSNQNKGARILNNVFPFTSVAIKTLEGKMGQIANGELAALTIPAKVQTALQGAFVPDQHTRDALTEQLPSYMRDGWERIHGPLLPGQYEVAAEVPWVTNTLHFFTDPKENFHPMIKILSAWATAKDQDTQAPILRSQALAKSVGEVLGRFAPDWLKDALQIAEINGAVNLGGVFKNDLLDTAGRAFLGLDKIDIKTPYGKGTNAASRNFNNLTDMGRFLEEHRGEDWMYDLVFPSKITTEGMTQTDEYHLAQRASFIKQHFRALTLGLATLTDMDKNVAINMGAMKRQHTALLNSMKEDISRQGYLPNAQALGEKETLLDMAQSNPKAEAALRLQFKMDSIHDYYDWYLHVEKKYPQTNPWKLLFGVDKYSYDKSDKPPFEDPDMVEKHLHEALSGSEEGEAQ